MHQMLLVSGKSGLQEGQSSLWMLRGPLLLKIPRVSKSKRSLGGRAFNYQAPLLNQVTLNDLLLCCHRIHMLGSLLLIYQTDINLLHCSPVV